MTRRFFNLTIILCFNLLFQYTYTFSQNETPAGFEIKPDYPNPVLAGVYSLLFPGGGYYYNGDMLKGVIASPLVLPLISYNYITTDTYEKKSVKTNIYRFSRNLYFYTIFDSYQDAIDKNPEYIPVLKIKHATPFETYSAPFRINNYTLPSMVLALPACSSIYDLHKKGINHSLTGRRLSYAIPLIIAQVTMIGVGEESFSRGFLYSAFSQATGSPFAGDVLQAADFGLRHTNMMTSRGYNAFPYGAGTAAFFTATINKKKEYVAEDSQSENLPDKKYFLNTFLFGLYLGFITGSREDGILTAIAIHSMWDAIVITRDLLIDGNTGKIYLEISIPYRF